MNDRIMHEIKHLTAGRMQTLGLLRKINNNSTPVLAGADYLRRLVPFMYAGNYQGLLSSSIHDSRKS